MTTSSETKTSAKLALEIIFILVVFIIIASYLLAMFLGPVLLFSPDGLTAGHQNLQLPILLFIVVGFYTPFALNVGLVFLFLWGVFAICLVAALQLRENLQEVIQKSLSCPAKRLLNNCLFALPLITSMMLVAVIAIHSFQEAGGIPTGEPPLPDNLFQALFELSYAALAEEIGFRVTPIGAFLIIYLSWAARENAVSLSSWQRLKLFFTAPLFPDEAKKIVDVKTVGDFGVKGGISLGEWIMVFFTSTVFGLAHYLAGGGWEIGKITSASAVGLAMGLTYLLYGVQAPILVHWFFNCYSYAYYVASELYTSILITFALIDLITIILGVLGWTTFFILGLRKIFGAIIKRDESRLTSPPEAS